MKTWNTTRTGMTFHSFNAEGNALCRSNIRRAAGTSLFTEGQVDARLAEAWGARVRGLSKCKNCSLLEAKAAGRVAASMEPSTGEGDCLPPAEAQELAAECETPRQATGVIGTPEQLATLTGPVPRIRPTGFERNQAASRTYTAVGRDDMRDVAPLGGGTVVTLTPTQDRTLHNVIKAGGIVGVWLNATRAIKADNRSCDALVARGLMEKGRTDGKTYFLVTGKGYATAGGALHG